MIVDPTKTNSDQLETILIKKEQELALLRERQDLIDGLPHIHARKLYKWQHQFIKTRKREAFISAANQVGKSSAQIIKVITLATQKELWPKFWPTHSKPNQFWYLMPTIEMCDQEFHTKWEPDFLPRNDYKNSIEFGWESEKFRGNIIAVHFRSGVSMYFKSYMRSVQALQAGTVWYIATDEEMPHHLWSELTARRTGVDGMFSMVFTSTLGEQMWFDTMELIGTPKELFPKSFKRIVSLYDCKFFMDGSRSHWTQNRINKVKNNCQNEADVKRRVYGRAVKSTGLLVSSFSGANVVKPYSIKDWIKYSGTDPGAGGDNHPAAICFVAIRPDYQRIAVYKGRRFDNQVTTHGDTFNEYVKLRGDDHMTMQLYDGHSADFKIITERAGETFVPADKDRKRGNALVDTLFKFKMLDIFEIDELQPLIYEIQTLSHDQNKSVAKDDFYDAMRYAISRINFDYSAVAIQPPDPIEVKDKDPQARKKLKKLTDDQKERMHDWDADDDEIGIDQEVDFWDDVIGGT